MGETGVKTLRTTAERVNDTARYVSTTLPANTIIICQNTTIVRYPHWNTTQITGINENTHESSINLTIDWEIERNEHYLHCESLKTRSLWKRNRLWSHRAYWRHISFPLQRERDESQKLDDLPYYVENLTNSQASSKGTSIPRPHKIHI